jgi:hypothetical protein
MMATVNQVMKIKTELETTRIILKPIIIDKQNVLSNPLY